MPAEPREVAFQLGPRIVVGAVVSGIPPEVKNTVARVLDGFPTVPELHVIAIRARSYRQAEPFGYLRCAYVSFFELLPNHKPRRQCGIFVSSRVAMTCESIDRSLG